jgi:succinate dehydrogenase/fumarate reductase flavoprotein subunit
MWPLLLLACRAPSPGPDAEKVPGDSGEQGDSGEGGLEDSAAPDAAPVVIVGAGVAGLRCAAKVPGAVLVEADSLVGGRARWSGGAMHFVGVPEQEAMGIFDSPEAALEDWEALTGAPPEGRVADYLGGSAALRDELAAIGLSWSGLSPEPRTGVPRILEVSGGGIALVDALEAALPAETDLRLNTFAEGLIWEGGAVVGLRLRAEDGSTADQPARAVVLASGGYAGSAAHLEGLAWAERWEPADEGGAGLNLDMAAAEGLATAALPAVGWYLRRLPVVSDSGDLVTVYQGSGAPWIGVDSDGQRFADENQVWSVTMAGPWRQHPGAWALSSRERIYATTLPEDRAVIDAAIEADLELRCAADAPALASALGLDAEGLEATLAQVEALRLGEGLDPWGRLGPTFPELTGELCAYRLGESAAKSFGGIDVDEQGRVRAAGSGQVVPGLHAIGEAAGMAWPGMGGVWGFDGSLSAILWGADEACGALGAAGEAG